MERKTRDHLMNPCNTLRAVPDLKKGEGTSRGCEKVDGNELSPAWVLNMGRDTWDCLKGDTVGIKNNERYRKGNH